MEFAYFCITLPQPWQNEARCDRQNYKLKWAYNFDASSSWTKCRPSKKRSLGSRNLQNMLYFLSASFFFAFWGVRGAGPRQLLGQRLLCIRLLSSCQYDGRKCHSHRWWEWQFFCKKSVDPCKKNPKLQEEATKNVFFHLELCSPMFGERSSSVFLSKNQWNWWNRSGIYVKTGLW